MILLIDNYDSFSYNLYQLVGAMNPNIRVIRNDAMSVNEIAALAPSHIILSPGPGRPEDAGVCVEVVRELGGSIPILGVCLGHQAIGLAFGGHVVPAKQLMHGKQSVVTLGPTCPLFAGLPPKVAVARYHSLTVEAETLPDVLQPVAYTDDAEHALMAVQHREHPIFGVQFHPESIMTPEGYTMLENFLAIRSDKR